MSYGRMISCALAIFWLAANRDVRWVP